MASYNRVVLLGNVTRDPELRYISSGTAVTDIGLAVNDRRKTPSGEWVEETTFVDVTLWGRTAEVAGEYVTKGAPLLIEGRLKLDTWEKDGKKNSKLRVVGEKMQLLGSRGEGVGRVNPTWQPGSLLHRAPMKRSAVVVVESMMVPTSAAPVAATTSLFDASNPVLIPKPLFELFSQGENYAYEVHAPRCRCR